MRSTSFKGKLRIVLNHVINTYNNLMILSTQINNRSNSTANLDLVHFQLEKDKEKKKTLLSNIFLFSFFFFFFPCLNHL